VYQVGNDVKHGGVRKAALARLRIPEVAKAAAAGETLPDLRELWEQAAVSERHDLRKP